MKICPKCKNNHEKSGIFCSRTCANSRGPRTEEFKRKVSEKLTGFKLSDEQCQKVKDNRWGKTYQSKIKISCCLNCEQEFETYNQKLCCCSRKCREEFNQRNRTAFENYYKKCKFTFNVYQYDKWFDLTLLEQCGWYKAKNRGDNLDGISRDHKFSVKEGFINNIDPRLISHPANCELKKHRENQSKHTKCSLTLEQLIEEIKKFDTIYGPMAE